MKLSEYKEDYYTFTGILSNINRQIAFAGIAIIWIFKVTDKGEIIIEEQLILPAILIVLSLGFDMIQYIYQSIIWAGFYSYHKSKGLSDDEDIESSNYYNYPSWFFFILKVLLLIIAYWNICEFLVNKFAI